MTSAPWRKNPLDYVLGPLNRDDFFANYHESKAIVINRDEPGRYSDLLSIARIDELLNAIDLDGVPNRPFRGIISCFRAGVPTGRQSLISTVTGPP